MKLIKCTECGGQIEVHTEQEFSFCTFCGAKYVTADVLGESDEVKIEKIKSQASIEMEQRRQELERERLHYEIKRDEKNDEKTEAQAFKKSKMSKVIIIFAALFSLFTGLSFINDAILSGITGVLMVSLLVFAYLIGIRATKIKKQSIRIIVTIVAFALIIPYFYFINFADDYKYENYHKSESFDWESDIELSKIIPAPERSEGIIINNSEEFLNIDFQNSSEKEYKNYLKKCEEFGFTIDAEKSENHYSAYNGNGYKLSLSYMDYHNEFSIGLDAPMEMSELSWPNSAIGKLVPVPDSEIGHISMEHSDSFSVYVGNTTEGDYNSYVNKCMDAGFNIDYSKSDKYFSANDTYGNSIKVEYEGNNIMYIYADAADDFKSEDNNVDDSEEFVEQLPDDTEETESHEKNSIGIRPDFKAAMDSYESTMDEYVNFMKKYNSSNGTDISLINSYAKYAAKYAESVEAFEKWESEDLNDAEMTYYIEVQTRVAKKLSGIV